MEVRKVRGELVTEVERRVYLEGLQKPIELAANNQSSGNDFVDDLFGDLVETLEENVEAGGDMISSMESIIDKEGNVIPKLVRAMLADEKHQIEKNKATRTQRELEEWGVKKDRRKLYSLYSKSRDRMVRASEMLSPAPAGHFLREFGQSDRDLIENASDNASVTQALTMLNGEVTTTIANPYSVFSRQMREGKTFKDRIHNVYKVMFSRPATPEEIRIFQQAFQSDPDSASQQSIAWTLLNTRQFLFIK